MTGDAAADDGKASKARLRLWLRLLKAQRRVEAELREKLRTEFGSTLPRFDVLSALCRSPKGLRMSELSKILMVSNGNVTGIVERLVADGAVIRVPVDGDRRAMRVRLTDKGSEYFAKLAGEHEGWVSELFGMFDAHEAENLASRLNSISDGRPSNGKAD